MNAIMLKSSVFEEYLTYIPTISDEWNAICPSEEQLESTSTQVLESLEYCPWLIDAMAFVHAGGCASVPATKNANVMTQRNIEPRCGTAAHLPQPKELHDHAPVLRLSH